MPPLTHRPPRPHTAPPRYDGRVARARRAAAELTPDAVERIAQRVAQLLRQNTTGQGAEDRAAAESPPMRLLDATQLARQLGVTRTWVYEHADELGAIRLGTGPKSRLRFNTQTVTQALREYSTQAPAPAHRPEETSRPGKPRRRPAPAVALLPIHAPCARGILARLTHTRRSR